MARTTQDDHDMFNHLENFGMLDAMMLDATIFRAKFESLFSPDALWRRFIRAT